MSWQSEWDALNRRVSALAVASERIFAPGTAHANGFNLVIQKLLYPQAVAVRNDLRDFVGRWANEFPADGRIAVIEIVQSAIGDDIWDPASLGGTPEGWRVIGSRTVAALMLALAGVAHQLGDVTMEAVAATERAIKHLQWMIASDEDVASKWQRVFAEGEPRCERLGATHLLHHGIWAYKAHSPRQRTDLVLGEPVEDTPSLRRAARALVLTEWKRILTASGEDVRAAASEGRAQASIYAGELLAGFDLRSVRYVIIVSRSRASMPDDETLGGITYRYLNVAVAPEAPSEAARTSESVVG